MPEAPKDPAAVAALCEALGLDGGDLIDAIKLLAAVKRDAPEEEKEHEPAKKIYGDKEFVFETRQDVFIYKDLRTKSKRYYVRIYDAKTKKDFVQSLRTSNRNEALVKAEKIYAEKKEALRRGVKTYSINTKELIRLYENERRRTISNVPHTGITQSSFNNLVKLLNYWQRFIDANNHSKTALEDIPPELAKGFGIWMKELPKQEYQDRERSNETINSTIAATKKMYRDIAIDEKYITMAEFPMFRYLKVNRETKPKRDIIEPEEFQMLRKWMTNKWARESGISDLERVKRYSYGLYLSIQYYLGCRNKEMLGIRWGDVSPIKGEGKLEQSINRAVFIPAENSKTGRSRTCVGSVAQQFLALQKHYKKLGITEFNHDDFVFINLSGTKRGKNIPYNQPAMERRLRTVLEGSGLQKILDETGRHITQYSARHYAAVDALMRGVSVYDLAMNLGTSVHYIEKTYARQLTTAKKSKEITKGQGRWKAIEEYEKIKSSTQAQDV